MTFKKAYSVRRRKNKVSPFRVLPTDT